METVMAGSSHGLLEEDELPLKDNQFTMSELLLYLNNAYKSKVSDTKFTHMDVNSWLVLGKMPEAYGGNALSKRRLSGLKIIEVVGLLRDDMRYVRGMKRKLTELPQGKVRRTALYYKVAGLPVPQDVLPDNWRAVGIRGNQLVHKKKKYLRNAIKPKKR